MTLQTARSSESLRQITIRLHSDLLVWKTVRSELQDLDNLLAELWTSLSICPKVKHSKGKEGNGGKLARSLLPRAVNAFSSQFK